MKGKRTNLGHLARLRPAENVRVHIADLCGFESRFAPFDFHLPFCQSVNAIVLVSSDRNLDFAGVEDGIGFRTLNSNAPVPAVPAIAAPADLIGNPRRDGVTLPSNCLFTDLLRVFLNALEFACSAFGKGKKSGSEKAIPRI